MIAWPHARFFLSTVWPSGPVLQSQLTRIRPHRVKWNNNNNNFKKKEMVRVNYLTHQVLQLLSESVWGLQSKMLQTLILFPEKHRLHQKTKANILDHLKVSSVCHLQTVTSKTCKLLTQVWNTRVGNNVLVLCPLVVQQPVSGTVSWQIQSLCPLEPILPYQPGKRTYKSPIDQLCPLECRYHAAIPKGT